MSVSGHPVEGKPSQNIGFLDNLDDDLITIEHMESIIWHALNDEINQQKVRDLAKQIAKSNIYVTPTLVVHDNLNNIILSKGEHANRLDMELYNPLVEFLDQSTYEYWASYQGDFKDNMNSYYQRCLKIFSEEGVKLSFGTDAGAVSTVPGASAIKELELYIKSGLTPYEAIYSATVASATALGLQNMIGKVSEGYTADLVLVEGNPLDNITTLKNPIGVIRGGVWFNETKIEQLRDTAKDASFYRSAIRGINFFINK